MKVKLKGYNVKNKQKAGYSVDKENKDEKIVEMEEVDVKILDAVKKQYDNTFKELVER